ncbi:MAG: molybdenum cofactor biosynthesis protein MoaE [Myxococcales bacterium]
MIRVQSEPFDPAAELAQFIAEAKGAGAVVSFVGIVRGRRADETVDVLELTHYPAFTEKSMGEIAKLASARFPIQQLAIVHRFGQLSPCEPIVFVAAAAAHRRAAFEAVDFLMDQLKSEAAFWKKEHGPGGSRWIEPTIEDRQDLERWMEDQP